MRSAATRHPAFRAGTSLIALIGGSGFRDFPFYGPTRSEIVSTGWGTASVRVGTVNGREVVFLPRHGWEHSIPPHRIDYRANIAALHELGIRAAIATTAVGSLRRSLPPGAFLVPDDLIDFTRDRTGKTFFDGQPGAPVVHSDLSCPYSEPLRQALIGAATTTGVGIAPAGTYLCTDGPRYETHAEVRLFTHWGADVVGMTGVPETPLAREAGIHYAALSVVTNYGAGISPDPLTHADVEAAMRDARAALFALITQAIIRIDDVNLPAIGPGVALPVGPRGEPNHAV